MNYKIFETPQILAETFAAWLVNEIEQAEGNYHIALSGGSTPKLLFSLLAENYAEKVSWEKVHFFWGDERCVPPEHDDSNYKMTDERLLQHINIPEGNIHRVLGEANPQDEATRYGTEITENLPVVDGIPQFDLVMLGMGGDGHTVSIFPHQIGLFENENTCVVGTNPDSGQERVTITGQLVNQAKHIAFLVTGKGKAEKVDEIFNQKENYQQYPAALVKANVGELTWYLDKDAASLLIN